MITILLTTIGALLAYGAIVASSAPAPSALTRVSSTPDATRHDHRAMSRGANAALSDRANVRAAWRNIVG